MNSKDTIFIRLAEATDDEIKEICSALEIPNTSNINTISKEYRDAAGHSFMLRGPHELPYKTILIDVVDKLRPGAWTTHTLSDSTPETTIEEEIEKYIFDKIKKEWDKLSPAEKKKKESKIQNELKKAGYSQTTITSVTSILGAGGVGLAVATPLTLSLFYSGFFATISASVFGVSSSLLLLTGTGVGAIISIPLLAAVIAGPAYRKTIPATIQMIRIRRRLEGESEL